ICGSTRYYFSSWLWFTEVFRTSVPLPHPLLDSSKVMVSLFSKPPNSDQSLYFIHKDRLCLRQNRAFLVDHDMYCGSHGFYWFESLFVSLVHPGFNYFSISTCKHMKPPVAIAIGVLLLAIAVINFVAVPSSTLSLSEDWSQPPP